MSGRWQTLFCSWPCETQERKAFRHASLTTCSKQTRQVTHWRRTRWTNRKHSNGKPIQIIIREPSVRTIATWTGLRSLSPSVSSPMSLRSASISITKLMRLWYRSSIKVSRLICRSQALYFLKKSGFHLNCNSPSWKTPLGATFQAKIALSNSLRAIVRSASCRISPSALMLFQLSSIFGVFLKSLRCSSSSQMLVFTMRWKVWSKSLSKRLQNTYSFRSVSAQWMVALCS